VIIATFFRPAAPISPAPTATARSAVTVSSDRVAAVGSDNRGTMPRHGTPVHANTFS
jgi:hypothetical protein